MSFDTVVWVLNHSESKGLDRMVLVALASHQNGRGSRPGTRRLADEAAVDERSLFRALRRLEETKAIEVVRGGAGRGRTNLYYVRTEKVTDCHQFCCKPDRGSSTTLTGVHENLTGVHEKPDSTSAKPLKSLYEPPKARVTSGQVSSNKGDLRSPQGPQRIPDDEPRNPLGASTPCLGDPCPGCGEAWTLGHRCETS